LLTSLEEYLKLNIIQVPKPPSLKIFDLSAALFIKEAVELQVNKVKQILHEVYLQLNDEVSSYKLLKL
jgi:hypothetical protein